MNNGEQEEKLDYNRWEDSISELQVRSISPLRATPGSYGIWLSTVAVRVFNAPEALSLTCRCRGVLTFILSTKNMSFVIYAGSVGFKATRCLCFLREDCWIWCCHSYLGLGLEESAAIIWRVVEYMNLDMTWCGCSDILTQAFSPFVQSLHKFYKCWLISMWRMSLRSEHQLFSHCLHCGIPLNTYLLHF